MIEVVVKLLQGILTSSEMELNTLHSISQKWWPLVRAKNMFILLMNEILDTFWEILDTFWRARTVIGRKSCFYNLNLKDTGNFLRVV